MVQRNHGGRPKHCVGKRKWIWPESRLRQITGACGLKLRMMREVKMFMAYMVMETQVVGGGRKFG